jgi:hypothetical protein
VTSLGEFFRDVHVPLDSEFLVTQWSRETEAWITEVYHIDRTLPLQMNRIGNWSSPTGIAWTNRSLVQRRGNLHGAVIKSGFINFVSFSGKEGYNVVLWYCREKSSSFTTVSSEEHDSIRS